MNTRLLTFAKEGHKYIFRYSNGCENQIIDELIQLAEDEDTVLDWLDAATLSYHVTQYAASECRDTLDPAANAENY